MTNINWFDNEHNWIGHFIITALEQKTDDKKFDGNNLNVELTIDGIEFDFISIIEDLGKQFEDAVLRKAKELHKKKMNDEFFNRIDELSYKARQLEEEVDVKLQEIYNREY